MKTELNVWEFFLFNVNNHMELSSCAKMNQIQASSKTLFTQRKLLFAVSNF